MNPKYTTILSHYSLAPGEIGNPVGDPVITEWPDGRMALIALDRAIRENRFQRYLIGMPDGRQLPMDAAYTEIFGVPPVSRANRNNLYPKLNK